MRTLILYVCLFVARLAAAQPQPDTALWLASFDQVARTVADKYWNPALNGLDWPALQAQYRPRVAAARSANEAREAIRALLGHLGHSHVGIVPREAYEPLSAARQEATVPFRHEVVDSQVVLASAPYRGWILRSVEDAPLAERLSRGKTPLDVASIAEAILRGESGQTIRLGLEDPAGKAHSVSFTLAAPSGRLVSFGQLPPVVLELDYARLSPQAGLIRISNFFDPDALNDLAQRAVKDCANCRGIIVDLRGNTGGIGMLAATLAGWFIEEPASLGTCQFRGSQLRLYVNPRAGAFRGKLAILIDERSLSTSEFFAQGMKDLGRARIFGRPSSGMALPSMIERLPMGDGFQYTTANYVTAGGSIIEGVGVRPDVPIPTTREHLRNGIDPVLAAAQSWLEKPEE